MYNDNQINKEPSIANDEEYINLMMIEEPNYVPNSFNDEGKINSMPIEKPNYVHDSFDLESELRNWALTNNATLKSINEILNIMRKVGVNKLPKDARTLLKTPTNTQIHNLDNGQYWHYGLQKMLTKILAQCKELPEEILLNFNIDGLPISHSSSSQFWPILCQIAQNKMPPFVVGVFHGVSKPSNVNTFLEIFVEECKDLISNGILIRQTLVNCKINNFICDAPARAFIKGKLYFFYCYYKFTYIIISVSNQKFILFWRTTNDRVLSAAFLLVTNGDEHF